MSRMRLAWEPVRPAYRVCCAVMAAIGVAYGVIAIHFDLYRNASTSLILQTIGAAIGLALAVAIAIWGKMPSFASGGDK